MTCDMSKLVVVKSERRQEDEEIYIYTITELIYLQVILAERI